VGRPLRRRPGSPIGVAAVWSTVALGLCNCSSPVLSDDSAPATLSPSSDARPIDVIGPDLDSPRGPAGLVRFNTSGESPASRPEERLAEGTVLRWKGRPSDPAAPATGFTVRPATGDWQERGRKNWATLQPAAHEKTPAPFRDPFGDQSPDSAAAIRLLPADGVASGEAADEIRTTGADDPAPAPPGPWSQKSGSPQQKSSAPGAKTFAPSRPFAAQKPSRALQLPPLEPAEPGIPDLRLPTEPGGPVAGGQKPSPAGERVPPGTPRSPAAPSIAAPYQLPEAEDKEQGKPCQRIYNGRNCCEEDLKCQTARKALRENSITKISLDITSPFKPDAATVEEERQAREDQMRQMPAREWRDRAGQVVASGRLTEIYNRKIQVTGADGTVATVPLGKLSDDDLCFLAASWGVPTECTLGDYPLDPRAWDQLTFTWKASALCHKPLYFEEVGLERYGHTMGPFLEPVHSGAHFFLNIAFLPYKMGINPPHECQYALGYYRPGNCAPWLLPPVPVSLRGALLQGAAAVGVVYLFP
jgi:hypothetical protein